MGRLRGAARHEGEFHPGDVFPIVLVAFWTNKGGSYGNIVGDSIVVVMVMMR